MKYIIFNKMLLGSRVVERHELIKTVGYWNARLAHNFLKDNESYETEYYIITKEALLAATR